jgi:hypothetical protein
MTATFDSAWYMAVNENHRFTLWRGVARTKIVPDLLVAELYLDDGATRFATVRGDIGSGAKIVGTLRRDDSALQDVPLRGYHFQVDEEAFEYRLQPEVDVSILLSDGWTTLGIAQQAPL